jgi:hypothetical protein
MAGLETIALAVAHLERLNDSDTDEKPQETAGVPTVPTTSIVALSSNDLPYPRLHGRMVSDDSIHGTNPSNMTSIANELPNSDMSIHSISGRSKQWQSGDTNQSTPSKRKSITKQLPIVTSSDVTDTSQTAGRAGIILQKISLVNEDLVEFFSLMEQLEQLALIEGIKQADVPKPDEVIIQVQRYDVLLGRGGETNHHVGNIQYRQLVKACQPAYLEAKRRDKPRIAAAIVRVVRAHSGRFLKKHANDNSWRDVGSTRAREKTSQALREGAPELRGLVEKSRSELLIEAVEKSLARKSRNIVDQPKVEYAYDPRLLHPPNIQTMSNGSDAQTSGIQTSIPKQCSISSSKSAQEPLHSVTRPTIVPPNGLPHYPMHHHVPMSMVHGPIYFHHPHGHVVYHPQTASMDGRYHHIYTDKRPMVTLPASEPAMKRQNITQTPSTSDNQVAAQNLTTETIKLPRHKFSTSLGDGPPEKSVETAVVSADHSEEEPVQVRSASPASSTSSTKNVNCRGPRVKLLKQRIEGTGHL